MSPEHAPTAHRAGRARRAAPSEFRVAVEVVLVSVLVGAVAGVIWWWRAPEVLVEVVDGGVALGVEQGGLVFQRDAVFTFVVAGAGLLVTVPMVMRHARRPVTTLLSLTAGGAAASALAMFVGRLLGPGPVDARAAEAAIGDQLALSLEIEAWAALLVWPIVATVVVGVVAAFGDDRSPWGSGDERSSLPMPPVATSPGRLP